MMLRASLPYNLMTQQGAAYDFMPADCYGVLVREGR